MFLGILRLALCVVVVCEEKVVKYPRLETDFCKLSKYDTQSSCLCVVPGSKTRGPTLTCSGEDQSKAKKGCQENGFSEGKCVTRTISTGGFTYMNKSFECPTTRGKILNDFRVLECYCDDDYKNSDDALTQYAKILHQLQSTLAKKECPAK